MDHAARITAYFASCTSGTPDEIAAHFSADAVIYDTNHSPVVGATEIGAFWERVRSQWNGAAWGVDRVVSDGDTAAIEWHMTGESDNGSFVFRGSEHYEFAGDLISEIRQYWTFDRERSDTGLQGYPYGA